MPLPPDPKDAFLNDLAGVEQRVERTASERHADERLDRSEKRYRDLVENSLGLICTHDLGGTLLSVNPAAADSLGYEPQHGIGRNLREFLAPGTRHLFDEYLTRIRDHKRDTGLMRVVRRDGSERLWLYRNVLCEGPDGETHVLGHAIDLTERAAAEAAVRRSQTQTLEATSRLAGRVAHAFNNLLTVIIGSAEMLMTNQATDARTRAHLDAIMRAASRGATVTRQLLAVGRQQLVDHSVLDLNVIISGLETALRRLAGPQITVHLVLEPSLPQIEGDAAQLEQVLLHLASNARDAMPDGGSIAIKTSSTLDEQIRARDHADIDTERCIWLTIQDTGCGMDATTREHLFEPFFTTKSAGLNAGLGLPAVYGIVHQLEGTIGVESEIGQGTTFTIGLPRAAAARSGRFASAPPASVRAEGAQTIVLVDDEDDVRSVMKSVLERRGYAVLEAASGADAIRLLADHAGRVDMLVTDVLMPGMSGRELYDHLARRHPGLKVLYVSGYTDDTFTPEFGRGAAFLSKPFLLDTLAQKVRDVLEIKE